MDDKNIALIRTMVPAFIGSVLTFVARWVAQKWGWEIDVESTVAFIAPAALAIVTGIYYKVGRLLEKKAPALGWLLGYPAAPAYTRLDAIDVNSTLRPYEGTQDPTFGNPEEPPH